MARISGVNLPKGKKIKIGLTYIYGIGKNIALDILKRAGVDGEKKVHELSRDEENSIQKIIQSYKVEGELRRMVREDITRLKSTESYRGLRHRRGLPLRGQRTRTNARTRKGRGRAIVGKKKVDRK